MKKWDFGHVGGGVMEVVLGTCTLKIYSWCISKQQFKTQLAAGLHN